MRDIATKVNNAGATPDGQLSAEEYNDVQEDIENGVLRSGQALIAADTTQMSRSMTLHGTGAGTMAVGGTANALVLTPLTGVNGYRMPSSYVQMDGMMVNLVPTADNTGNVTIDIGQTAGTLLGTKKFLDDTGAELGAGALVTGTRIFAVYDATADGAVGAWIFFGGEGGATGIAGGDLSGSYPNPNVVNIQNYPIEPGVPIIGQTLIWTGSQWTRLLQSVRAETTTSGDVIILIGQNGPVTLRTLDLGTLAQGEHGIITVTVFVDSGTWGPTGNYARLSLRKDSGTGIIEIMGFAGSSLVDSLKATSPPSPIPNGHWFVYSAPFTVTTGGTYVLRLEGNCPQLVTVDDLTFSSARVEVLFTTRFSN